MGQKEFFKTNFLFYILLLFFKTYLRRVLLTFLIHFLLKKHLKDNFFLFWCFNYKDDIQEFFVEIKQKRHISHPKLTFR
jgi:hypothetical protein